MWLYLPAAFYTTDERGHGTSVTPAVVIGKWDAKMSVWVAEPGQDPIIGHLFPSLFSDAKVDGPKPDNPLIGVD
jgi:hypothetical protein